MNVLASLGEAVGVQVVPQNETVQQIDALLKDDNIQVISSLQLNQIASYTFHESSIANGQDLSEQIIELLATTLSKPLDHSALTLQKTLVVVRHVLVFGAEKNLNVCVQVIGRFVPPLLNYNTALIAQQQTGATGMLMRIKGGSVDKGGPVREQAQHVNNLLTNRQHLMFERSNQQDPNSLVPVGSKDAVAFVTDEVRWKALQARMERERSVQLKSNLAKQSSAFGGGYNARDGKAVVGAAHGIEEMMKQAQKEKQKFSDDGKPINDDGPTVTAADFADYTAPSEADLLQTSTASTSSSMPVVNDLLGMAPSSSAAAATAPAQDLLGFGGGGDHTASSSITGTTTDLLGTASSIAATQTITANRAPSTAVAADPFGGGAAVAAAAAAVETTSSTPSLLDVTAAPTVMKSKNIMSTPGIGGMNNGISGNDDPFAALDALAPSSFSTTGMNGSSSGLTGLSSLSGGMPSSTASTASSTAITAAPLSSLQSNNPLTDLSSLSISAAAASPPATTTTPVMMMMMAPTVSATSMKVSQAIPGGPNDAGNEDDDDDDNGFVMGGAAGSGLVPAGPAPAAPPPPPPPGGVGDASLPW